MKKITIITAMCAFAFAGISLAQDAPLPIVAPATEASPAAKQVASDMVALLKEVSTIMHSIKDKATADEAAVKLKAIEAKGKALEESANKLPEAEMQAAMEAHGAELMGIIFGAAAKQEEIKKADYYGSEALKAVVSEMEQ